MVDDSNVNLPNITTPESSPFLSDIHITEEQVFDHLSTLDISKASGPDRVVARLLKSAARELCKPLTNHLRHLRFLISGKCKCSTCF